MDTLLSDKELRISMYTIQAQHNNEYLLGVFMTSLEELVIAKLATSSNVSKKT